MRDQRGASQGRDGGVAGNSMTKRYRAIEMPSLADLPDRYAADELDESDVFPASEIEAATLGYSRVVKGLAKPLDPVSNCELCGQPLTAEAELRRKAHDACRSAKKLVANPPTSRLIRLYTRGPRTLDELKLYRYRCEVDEPEAALCETPALDGKEAEDACKCDGAHTDPCRQRQRRQRIAEEQRAAGISVRRRGRPLKGKSPRTRFASVWLDPQLVEPLRAKGIGIADIVAILARQAESSKTRA